MEWERLSVPTYSGNQFGKVKSSGEKVGWNVVSGSEDKPSRRFPIQLPILLDVLKDKALLPNAMLAGMITTRVSIEANAGSTCLTVSNVPSRRSRLSVHSAIAGSLVMESKVAGRFIAAPTARVRQEFRPWSTGWRRFAGN
jgi:hypothetical protein